MRVAIAIDSFKGSLSSYEAGHAAADGILAVDSNAETVVCPLADGGEGTALAITSAMGGRLCKTKVCGPLGDEVEAEYGVIPEERTAIIEMASAAGITLIDVEQRNPLRTTTYGKSAHRCCEACKKARQARDRLFGMHREGCRIVQFSRNRCFLSRFAYRL